VHAIPVWIFAEAVENWMTANNKNLLPELNQ
jgi:hypothetical protein